MIARQLATAIVLALLAGFALLAALGVLRSKNNLAALHALGICSVAVPPLTLIAVLIDTGFGVSAVKTLCFIFVLLIGAPITSHAIALAEYRRRAR